MGAIKGAKEYKKWVDGDRLTRKESQLAHCYMCNGFEYGAKDCKGKESCPSYEFFGYKGKV